MIQVSKVVYCSILLSACTAPSKEKQDAIQQSCQGKSIKEVKKIDDISESCKAAIAALLPSPTSNLNARLFNLGQDTSSDRHKLVMSGTQANGESLTAEALSELKVSVVEAGIAAEIPKSTYTTTKSLDSARDLLSIAEVGDYSGSMGDNDIALVSELFGDFTKYLTPIANFEVIYFSSEVLVQQALTADQSLLTAALTKNSSIPRTSTALYDGMGKAIEDLAASTRPGHILVVGTDGMENSSVKYSKDSLLTALKADKKLLLVIMGTFLSDVDEMKELVGDRGIFVYARDVNAGKQALLAFSKALRESVTIEISELYKSAKTLKVDLGQSSVTFNL